MLLLILVIGGVAAMTMSSRGENTYKIEPNINLGSIPEFDASQNREDIENKLDKTVEDVVMVEIEKQENLKKFEFGDVDRQVEVMVKWMLYEASTMWSMYNYLDWYMKKNEYQGLDDLRAYGPMEESILDQVASLVAICKKRAMEFRTIWIRLNEFGNFAWMAANQWLLNTPMDIMNQLRQFDSSEISYKAALEIADGRSMADVNEKLLWLYKKINKQPSGELANISATLQDVIENQNIMMQVDDENQGRFAMMGPDGYANLKRTTHQVRAPSEDPYSGAPGSYSKTATYVGQDGVPRTMNVTYDANTQMTYGQPGAQLPTQAAYGGGFANDSHRMAPTETITIPPKRPDPNFDHSNATGQFGTAYAGIDPRNMTIDSETKSDLFGVKKGGNLFANSSADFADQRETYQNAPSYNMMDDVDSNAPPRATNVPASTAMGFVTATAKTIKPFVTKDAYTKEITGTKRTVESEFNFTNAKRYKSDTKNPSPSQQDLDAADADPYDAAAVPTYDILQNYVPRDDYAQEGNVESWPAKNSGLRTISEIPAMPQTQMDGDTQYAADPAAATSLGIGVNLTEISVPKAALMTNPYAAVQVNPAKESHLAVVRPRSYSMDKANLEVEQLISPKKKTKDEIDHTEASTRELFDTSPIGFSQLF